MSDLKMELVDVYSHTDSVGFLYTLLAQRQPFESISHKKMPYGDEHEAFVASQPYEYWYLILSNSIPVGAIYLSKQREIGISIETGCRGKRYGINAIGILMRKHPGRFFANIAPNNQKSIDLFDKLGFRYLRSIEGVQNTYIHG